MNKRYLLFCIAAAALLLAAVGCGTNQPAPAVEEPAAGQPAPNQETAVTVTASPALIAAETSAPPVEASPTAAPPTAGATAEPTQLPEVEATAVTEVPTQTESSPTATALVLPDGWYGPDNYPDGMNPLTGEMVDDPAVLERRPIAIKISNYPEIVRPQAGLNKADLVFEHYAEGGVTRFTAIFYSQDARPVGSVRSARIIDFEIPVMYDAAFGFSGAAGPNKERFGQVDWFNRIISPDFKNEGFYRAQTDDPDIDFWHLMFTDTYRLREILQARGQDVPPEYQNGMIFSETPPAGGSPAKQVELGYRGSYVTWWYDSGNGRYYRWNDGQRHDDANTDQQVNFKNIAVVAAEHVDTWIPETEVGQGAKSIEIQIWGEGPATIFRDGQRFEGRWQRLDPGDMLTFSDLDGNPLPLGIGNTWFQLVPLGFDKLYVTS